MSAVVEQAVQAHLILSTRRSARLRVTLRYRADDPLAVRMGFPAEYSLDAEHPMDPEYSTGPEHPMDPEHPMGPASAAGPEPEIEWIFARHLLAAGLDLPSGVGDVHIRPAQERHTVVELRAAEGVALLRFDTAGLRRFLWHSYLAVPEGEEFQRLDADRALAELLS
ncbi:SsgA family sporulation/cell division regulator [Kitasatospora sp. MAP5-34]|uniref:SsgA family sporulation/cell division regulator n=1 Tax=Kitasatospora sp. MAP5-34 TaxID=3035102 RepID=UPI002476CE02|nr:SsgA family sporulation/cell division regulator [Kitasatospora sp. MAP5-34]MDH6577160.1 hypothetical protein [Kitasatospora sp. MAP5-34]